MKNIFTFLFIFSVISMSAENYYYDGAWKKVSDDTAGVPPSSSTSGDSFEIRADGYTVSSYTEVYDFVIQDGFKVTINDVLNVYGQFNIQGSGFTPGIDVGASGELVIGNGALTPLIGRPISYLATTSKVTISKTPSSSDFNRVDPNSSSKGWLVFNKLYETYNVGGLTISPNVNYSFGQSNITLDGNLTIESSTTLNQDNLTVTGALRIVSGNTFTVASSGMSVNGVATIEANAKLVINSGESATFLAINIESDYTGQGLIIGTGITCDTVTFQAYLNGSSNGYYGDGRYWRELGFPFDVEIQNVTWGSTFNNSIQNVLDSDGNPATDPDDSFINKWDATNQQWLVPSKTDKVTQSMEVWMKGGETISITGGKLSTSHNVNKDYTLSSVGDWYFMANPFASNLDLARVLYDFYRKAQGYTAYVLTDVNGVSYKTVDDRGNGTLGTGYISPLQAFWIVVGESGTATISTSNQSSSTSAKLMKTNDERIKPLMIEISLSSDSYVYELLDFYFKENGGHINTTVAEYDAYAMNVSSTSVPTSYVELENGGDKLIKKEYDDAILEGGAFSEDIFVLGEDQKDLQIELSDMTIDPSYNVYLVDKQDNLTHLLNDSPYSFTHDPSDDAARFEIRITTETLGEAERVESSSIKLANKGNSIEFMMPSTSSIESVQLISLNGQVVKSVQATKGQTEFDVSNLNKGIYIAQLKLASGNVASYKFVR